MTGGLHRVAAAVTHLQELLHILEHVGIALLHGDQGSVCGFSHLHEQLCDDTIHAHSSVHGAELGVGGL